MKRVATHITVPRPPVVDGILQRACACRNHHPGSVGECAKCHKTRIHETPSIEGPAMGLRRSVIFLR